MGVIRLLVWLWLCGALLAADFQAGVARVQITPENPILLSGYPSRRQPSEGVLHELWAKALAIEDPQGNRLVIVSTDLIGLPRVISDELAARVARDYGLDREQLLFNSSHTFSGPIVWPGVGMMPDMPPGQEIIIKQYSRRLVEDLFSVIGSALGNLAPARLSFGQGSAGFSGNLHELTPERENANKIPSGPVEHSVPVLRVTGLDNETRAVVFGYACQNSTITDQNHMLSGDYAGFAQIELEKSHPGSMAIFIALCGGDRNPTPRGTQQLAEEYGQALAMEVTRVLNGKLTRVRPPIRAAFQMVDLDYALHTRDTFQKQLADENQWVAQRAREILKAYDERRPPRRLPYPVQAVRFNKDLVLLALGGEVVADYAVRAKREFPKETLVVVGYSNDVMSYIPSLRLQRAGSYEATNSPVYYGQPGPLAEDTEETIFNTIRQVMRRVGARIH